MLSPLQECLQLEQVAGSDIFVGQARRNAPTKVLFGGQVMSQSLAAAARTVHHQHRVHSFHGHFLLAGKSDLPILFEVSRIRDGRSFTTRNVIARQDNKAIFSCTVSFHCEEAGAQFQIPPADVRAYLQSRNVRGTATGWDASNGVLPTPDELRASGIEEEGWMPSTSFMPISEGNRWSLKYRRHKTPLAEPEPTPSGISNAVDGSGLDDWEIHTACLAYMSDEGLLSTIRQPHTGPSWKRFEGMSMSLDHTIHFHRPFRADEWLLFHNETTVSYGGRGLARTEVYTADGTLVASVLQEGLIRPPKAWLLERRGCPRESSGSSASKL
jgi:acyl-CoA thioesterase-2